MCVCVSVRQCVCVCVCVCVLHYTCTLTAFSVPARAAKASMPAAEYFQVSGVNHNRPAHRKADKDENRLLKQLSIWKQLLSANQKEKNGNPNVGKPAGIKHLSKGNTRPTLAC